KKFVEPGSSGKKIGKFDVTLFVTSKFHCYFDLGFASATFTNLFDICLVFLRITSAPSGRCILWF
ncbi:MAG: hypothetical protein RSC23_07295, partial [Carnobacterium sp.]|uniref:hypothetical protein n=1 Tax=Carnobacterium sp. TaxID=48221 RepID=UPI002FC9327C